MDLSKIALYECLAHKGHVISRHAPVVKLDLWLGKRL